MQPWYKRIVQIVSAATLACLGVTASAADDDYPAGPIRWIVGYQAGGGSDVTARTVATVLQQQIKQTLVVENRPGAATMIGMNALLSAPADGYTIASADIASLVFNPALYTKLTYDPAQLDYVGGMVRHPFVLVVRQGLPVTSLQEFLSLARSQPGQLTYASAGNGSPHHVSMEMLQQRAGLRLVHVPYKGGAPAFQALMAGQVDAMMMDVPGGLLPNLNTGRFKILGIALPDRLAILPDVPTMAQAGLEDVVAYSFQLVVIKAQTPEARVQYLSAALQAAMQDPEVVSRMLAMGAEIMPLTAQQTRALVRSETEKWVSVIKAANIQLD